MSSLSLNFPLVRLIQTGCSAPRTRLSQRLGEIGVMVLLCGGVLAPQWNTSPRVRRELFILVAIIAAYGWMLLIGKSKQIRMRFFYLIGVVFSISVTLSLIYGTEILHHQISLGDFFDIPKCFLPLLYFCVGYAAQLCESGLRRLMDVLAVAAILICLFGFAQFFDWNVAAWLLPLYGDGSHNDYALLVYHRVFSTLTNPNVLSQYLSWTMITYVLALVFGIGSRWRNGAVAVFCVITIVLSSSRYGILSVGFGFLFVLGLAIKTRGGLSRVLGLVTLFVLFSGVFLVVSQRGSYIIAKRFDELRNPTQVSSLRGRLDFLWIDAASYFLSSPIVGHGPAKTIFENTFTDSEYLDILKWYGLVGFSIYICYYGWPLLQIRKGLKSSVHLPPGLEGQLGANLLAMRIGFVMLCMALFMNIGMFTCFNWYLMCYLWVWVGVSVRAAEVVREAAFLAGALGSSANRSPMLWPSLATFRLGNAASNL